MDFLGDLAGDLLGDVVTDKAGKGLRRVLGRRGPANAGWEDKLPAGVR